jgi:hypothetical protein
MPRIEIDETTITRADGPTSAGGAYSITKIDARGSVKTTEYSKGGKELARYEGHPKPLPAPAPEPEPAA